MSDRNLLNIVISLFRFTNQPQIRSPVTITQPIHISYAMLVNHIHNREYEYLAS